MVFDIQVVLYNVTMSGWNRGMYILDICTHVATLYSTTYIHQ